MDQENTAKRKRGRPPGSKNKKKLPVKLEEDKLLQIYKLSSILTLIALRYEVSSTDKVDKSQYELAIKQEHIHYQLINLCLAFDKEIKRIKQEKAKYMQFILNRPTF